MAQVAEERGFQIESMENRFKAIAAEDGLEFKSNERIYNTRLAHELSAWATESGKGYPFHMAIFLANYVEGVDISSIDVLAEIADSVGLSKKAAKQVREQGNYGDHVDRDWALCRQLEIVAAPTFIINEKRLVGAQSYEMMERLVTSSGSTNLL